MLKQARIAALAMMFWITGLCYSAIPGADNPQAYTEHQFLRDKLEFQRTTLVEAYKKVGNRDLKWDNSAIALLEAMSLYFTNANVTPLYRQENVPQKEEVEKLARQAVAAGCDDPLVLDMFSIALLDQGKTQEGLPLLRKAADQIRVSKHSPFRAANSVRRLLKSLSGDNALAGKYRQILYDGDLAMAKGNDWPGISRRAIHQVLFDDMESWPIETQASFCKELKANNSEPWITNMLTGRHHINVAWAARGGGFANTVNDAGWRKMGDELQLARECLLEAHRLHPEYPEAATTMITVVMGGVAGPGESLRSWFDRAVQAQFDYAHAYESYLYAMLPRWHGSYREMYEIGLECADSGRFNTRVPGYLVDALVRVQNDMEGDWAVWRQAGVFDQVADVLNRYSDAVSKPEEKIHYLSRLTGFAWQVGRYDLGRKALDKAGGKFSVDSFTQTMTIPLRTVAGTYAMTGTSAQKVQQAEADFAAGKYDAALETYHSLAKQTPAGDPSAPWMRNRLQELIWQQQFNAGEPVNLIAWDAIGNSPAGWYASSGNFRADGTSITGTTGPDGAELICGTKFGLRWEMRGRIEILPGAKGTDNSLASAGPLFGFASPTKYYGIHMRPLTQQVLWYFEGALQGEYYRQLKSSTNFVIRWWDGHVEALLDDEVFLNYRELWPLARRPDNRIGFASFTKSPGVQFKITDLQIRKLEKEPRQ